MGGGGGHAFSLLPSWPLEIPLQPSDLRLYKAVSPNPLSSPSGRFTSEEEEDYSSIYLTFTHFFTPKIIKKICISCAYTAYTLNERAGGLDMATVMTRPLELTRSKTLSRLRDCKIKRD